MSIIFKTSISCANPEHDQESGFRKDELSPPFPLKTGPFLDIIDFQREDYSDWKPPSL